MVAGQGSTLIGAAVKRKEDPRLITGEGKYTGDVQLSGMTYMAVLRSPHAHAHIRRIDAARALQQPGVLAVLTGPEVEQHCQMQFRLAGVREGMHTKSRWPMATEVAKYAGEPVAAVLAASSDHAQDALAMIDVEYESLPAVMDLEQAVEEGHPWSTRIWAPISASHARGGLAIPTAPSVRPTAWSRRAWSSPASSLAPWNPGPWWPATNAAPAT